MIGGWLSSGLPAATAQSGAAPVKELVNASLSGRTLGLQLSTAYDRATVRLAGATGLLAQWEFAGTPTAALDLVDQSGNPLPDGNYNYEMHVYLPLAADVQKAIAEAESAGDQEALSQLGKAQQVIVYRESFAIQGGTAKTHTDE
jgi:ABC-type transport system substrate-binding protein